MFLRDNSLSSTPLPLLHLEAWFILTVVEFINTESSTQLRPETVKTTLDQQDAKW